ncbi:MAG: valine--tRNA ligase [Candidatus Thermoplasmatota archaeon]
MSDYDQKSLEEKWQKKWQKKKVYRFDPDSDKKVFSIDVPPRYASGSLHAGHAVHYTHIDFAARYKRMQNFNVFFPLCFDVNGIPIEERVERQRDITRKDIDRQKFNKLCSEFAEKNIKKMTEQFRLLGESMDPSIYYQTNAEYYRRITQISFIEMFKKDLIYKGMFPVNWCPRCMTAMADAEVEYKKRNTNLNTIKFYFVEDQPDQILKYHGIEEDKQGKYVEIATTRPEMLSSCQIVAVHPTDERAPWLIDKKLKVPLFNKEIKVVDDETVDPDFGSGIVMICTVGDREDLNWVFKYDLPLEMSINEEGRMTELCGKYQGMKIDEAKKQVIQDLKKQDLLLNKEKLSQNVGVCWRCKTPVEFVNAEQWFLKTVDFKDMVLEKSDEMDWYPDFMETRLKDWVNSLEWDWVISRQRYFATPIPLWECEKCDQVVLAREEDCYVDPTVNNPPVEECPKCGGKLVGCEDVFDTWMDSSVSPLYNTFWRRDEEKFEKLYPMSLRPQAHDIIRTWAFYTILRCTLITEEKPFENMMMGGFILSKDGTPMHTSLGNVIDPLEVIDEYGTDAFRCYAASCTLGEDNPFREKDVIRGRKLLRKIWNLQKFTSKVVEKGEGKPSKDAELSDIDIWILSKFSRMVEKCTQQMDEFDYSQTMKDIEYFLWHELADHYIEMIKSEVYSDQNIENIRYTLYTVGLGVLKLFAPFFPHLTEEIFDLYYKKFEKNESIHISSWPKAVIINPEKEKTGETIKNYISEVRRWKSEQGIPLNAELPAFITYGSKDFIKALEDNQNVVKNTLKYPDEHVFKVGKPDVEEKIVEIKPNFSVIGPKLKKDSKKFVSWIKNNQKEIIEKIEEKKDIPLSNVTSLNIENDKGIVENDFVELEKDVMVKGKENRHIISLDDFFLEVKKT